MSTVALLSATAAGLAVFGCAAPLARPPSRDAEQAVHPRSRAEPPVPGRSSRMSGAFVAAAASAAISFVGGATLGVLFLVAATAAVVFRARRRRATHQRALEAAYPLAIDLLALTMRAGFTTPAALRMLASNGPEVLQFAFIRACRRLDHGARTAAAIGTLTETIGPRAGPLVRALTDADGSGLPLGPVLDRLEQEARQQRQRDADSAARRLPVRLSFPLVVCMLPAFTLLAVVPLLATAFAELRTLNP